MKWATWILALGLLVVRTVVAREAPRELCYGHPVHDDRRPVGPATDAQPVNPLAPANATGTDYSRGCEMRLLDPPLDVSSRSSDPVNVTVAWFFDGGHCKVPLVHREYYGCPGDAMPSVETCTGGYSYTRTRIDTLMEYALVNASLVLQPGLYDAGLYIVVLVFGDDAYLGTVSLSVEANLDYPCGMKHGLTITRPGATLPPIAPTAGDHQRWRGCFPSTDEGAWENVTAAEKGLSDDYADYYDVHIFRSESDDEVVHGDAPEAPEGEEVTEEEAELTSSDLDNIEIEVVGSPAAPAEGPATEEGRGAEEDEELTSSDLDNIEIEVVGSPRPPASSPPPPPPRPHPRGRDHDHDHGHHRADDRGPQRHHRLPPEPTFVSPSDIFVTPTGSPALLLGFLGSALASRPLHLTAGETAQHVREAQQKSRHIRSLGGLQLSVETETTNTTTTQTGLSGDIRTSIYICVALAGLVVVGIVIMCLHMAIIRARARNDGYRHVASA
ncbi:envelope glycoprotein G [Suid alphaherpesvirus 1]|uniref:Envelope glycoprotein G n=2 Tax=Suid herpesvirus 1 TaxID=10345 RepID=GG_SUHVR|nr:envelope glycoprotein G [Suid alphaherpesvirus 1]P07562.1 RecName: Full=Envelope glycoprotein G; Short=gG; Flags: Precursor [Suid herpesvirus 1 (strain Rice)]AAC35206.1 glycoprotein gX [Suid alphaherpesvirus 1]DAA02206.1 TPA_exp: secreted glycoprotein gG precursor [Suid alphaherpesvirus 1]